VKTLLKKQMPKISFSVITKKACQAFIVRAQLDFSITQVTTDKASKLIQTYRSAMNHPTDDYKSIDQIVGLVFFESILKLSQEASEHFDSFFSPSNLLILPSFSTHVQ
jgi:hypothetical protein